MAEVGYPYHFELSSLGEPESERRFLTRRLEMAGLVRLKILQELGIEVDRNIIEALECVPRHEFIPDELRQVYLERAYDNVSIPLTRDSRRILMTAGDEELRYSQLATMSEPVMVGLMSQLVVEGLGKEEVNGAVIGEVGMGSGYQAAVLAEMGMAVETVEVSKPVFEAGKKALKLTGYDRGVRVHLGNGFERLLAVANYQRLFKGMLVTAGVPLTLDGIAVLNGLDTVCEEGRRIVYPLTLGAGEQVLMVRTAGDGSEVIEGDGAVCACVFVGAVV